MDSATNNRCMAAADAPRAFSKPISAVRWDTATSMTFMIKMPATARLMAAIPATVKVSARRMRSKVASTASWVMMVTSSSPSWRSRIVSRTRDLALARASRVRASTRTRNSDSVLNNASADATGITTTSSMSTPIDRPSEPSTPITRKRRSPMRTHSPSAFCGPKSSWRILVPSTQIGVASRGSVGGRKRPCPMLKCRMLRNSLVDPSTIDSRSRRPHETAALPTATGATRCTLRKRFRAKASSMVRSRGVSPSSGGGPPVVSERPGNTISRCVPSDANSPTTKRRAPSPSDVRITTAATPMAIASSINAVRTG